MEQVVVQGRDVDVEESSDSETALVTGRGNDARGRVLERGHKFRRAAASTRHTPGCVLVAGDGGYVAKLSFGQRQRGPSFVPCGLRRGWGNALCFQLASKLASKLALRSA